MYVCHVLISSLRFDTNGGLRLHDQAKQSKDSTATFPQPTAGHAAIQAPNNATQVYAAVYICQSVHPVGKVKQVLHNS